MDADLQSVQQARDLVVKARAAQELLNTFTQKQADAICAAKAEAGFREAERLAELAVEETGLGRADSKTFKNVFCTRDLWAAMKDMPTCGIIKRDDRNMVYEIAEPMGVVAAIIPTTNPTSTALYKILIAMKSRNAIVVSPHPRAIRCIAESARVMLEAALKAGAPDGCIGCMTAVTLEGTTELMRHKHTSVIVSTGGEGIVKAAYSSGKPAYGVGPGNVPTFIERTADIRLAVTRIIESQLFDYGTVCASEQSVVVDAPIAEQVREEFRRQKAYFVTPDEKKKMEPVVIKGSLMNPEVVGQPAAKIAKMCGFAVPDDTSVLLVELKAVGPQEPISREKLCPVLGYFVEPDWHSGCERCIQVLRFGGMGHTLVIHSRNPGVIMEFALKKPAYRLLVNTGSTQGAIGASTRLFPSMSLGCGTSGGNISADNIGPQHLINVKRLAFDQQGDPWASQMKVTEQVSDFVPLQREKGPERPASGKPYTAAEIEQMIVYNGRRREVRNL
ncbi:MAG: aldehyde dehydrogenase family protein [Planctomycetes bacterium]|nr:aldehyde dehydrogenase family protein [Planctomycetota bacterium]